MNQPKNYPESLCFCTAAFGNKYVSLAKLLASDLYQFAPNHPFVVITDKPIAFQNQPNVIAIEHWCRGVLAYHERRFAIKYALSLSSTVMYFDADVRICSPIPHNLDFNPGLTARSCGDMKKHLRQQFDKPILSQKLQRKQHIITKMAEKAGIYLDSSSVKFINEFLFVVKADDGRELDFLQLWGEFAIYADTLGLHKHPTYAMALAAVKSGLPIHHSNMDGLNFFDDRIEKIRLDKGQSSLGERSKKYFQEQAAIEQQDLNLPQRVRKLAQQKLSLAYNSTRVKLTSVISPSVLLEYPTVSLKSPQPGQTNLISGVAK
jgi:hypothetical protein